jgi:type I restriction enzyme R subunit
MVENNFEKDIESSLINQGYIRRVSSDYDSRTALDQELLFKFIRDTQVENWQKLEKDYGSELKKIIVDSIYNEINSRGLLEVLRKGITIDNVNIKCTFRKPYSKKNKRNYELYQKNIFSLIRQLYFSDSTGKSIDLGLFLNGFLVATVELKDQFSKQNVYDAIKQYKHRDIIERIFQFKRGALVHFAVDYFDIFITTKLDGQETIFIPFNKYPNNETKGYKTSYLWDEIWEKESWLDILLNFIQVERTKSQRDSTIVNENIIFPRYHQWDTVRKLIVDTQQSGAGKRYLIEHSTGSGKSKTISWLCYELFSLHDNNDKNIFDSVIVISDRNVIIKQLNDDIRQLDETPGIVKNPSTSVELGDELEKTHRILISTQQKFHDVGDRIAKLAGKHFAIIVDEAQSSQGGESSKKVMEALTDLDEFGERIMKYDSSNLSYYGFSGTPKPKTLTIFGRKGADGKYRHFHLYSMKQAIDEGFVLDVLKNYTTYRRYFQLIQKGNDKQVHAKKAIRAIMRLVNEDPKNITKKSQFIVEHFYENIKHRIGGKAKAMLITNTRKQAILYKKAIDEYISSKNFNLKTLAAFSSSVNIGGINYTEENLNNPLYKKNFDLVNWFSSSEYQLLIVADKFRVGFNQPLLHTMYIDKKLNGVNVVQTLSRLNRKIKGKDDVCIIDFVNTVEEIKEEFSPYYQGTVLSDNLDPQLLDKLYQQILSFGIIIQEDVQEFWRILMPESGEKPSNEDLVTSVSDARSRFKLTNEHEQLYFKRTLVNYVENYAYLTQIMDYNTSELEKLYMFARRLLPTLPDTNRIIPQSLKDDIAVKYIELKKTFEGTIELPDKEGQLESAISTNITKSTDIVAVLSELILRINQEFSGRPITQSDFVCIEKLVNSIVHDDAIISHFREKGNSVENIIRFSSFKDEFNEKLAKVMRYNEELYIDIKNNDMWRKTILQTIADKIKVNISQTGEIELPVISDDIPRNKESYRKALESCQDFMWFEDRFLNMESLTLFEDVIKNTKVKSIRIISSLVYNKGINVEFLNKIKEFKKILSEKNITFEVKIASTKRLHRKIHDRYVLGTNILWNLPPSGSVLDGQSSTFKEYKSSNNNYKEILKDYVEWWDDSEALEIIEKWNEIKKQSEQYSTVPYQRKKYDAKCSICGKPFQVWFIPDPKRSIYCDEHLKFRKGRII